jgi:prolyl 4-hydroxylase
MYKIFLVIFLVLVCIVILYNLRQNFISLEKQHFDIVRNPTPEKFYPKYREEILSENPKIIYIHNFITPEEAQFFIDYGTTNKRPSTIATDAGPTTLSQDVRSSESAFIPKHSNTIVSNLENRAVEYFSSNINNLEPLQVVVYEKGQKYNPHYDFFTPNTEDVEQRGNRQKTILVYLNNIPKESGGATYFPKLNLRIQPSAYDAIYFENMNDNHELDYNTLHAGEPILNDVKKYAINIWLREKSFDI